MKKDILFTTYHGFDIYLTTKGQFESKGYSASSFEAIKKHLRDNWMDLLGLTKTVTKGRKVFAPGGNNRQVLIGKLTGETRRRSGEFEVEMTYIYHLRRGESEEYKTWVSLRIVYFIAGSEALVKDISKLMANERLLEDKQIKLSDKRREVLKLLREGTHPSNPKPVNQ